MTDNDSARLRSVLAYNLTSFVRQSGYSQAQIAAATEISTSALSAYCSGTRYPRPSQLKTLANFFNTTVGALTDDEQARNKGGKEFSQEAYWIASSFEELDSYGRELVRVVVENELRRFESQRRRAQRDQKDR